MISSNDFDNQVTELINEYLTCLTESNIQKRKEKFEHFYKISNKNKDFSMSYYDSNRAYDYEYFPVIVQNYFKNHINNEFSLYKISMHKELVISAMFGYKLYLICQNNLLPFLMLTKNKDTDFGDHYGQTFHCCLQKNNIDKTSSHLKYEDIRPHFDNMKKILCNNFPEKIKEAKEAIFTFYFDIKRSHNNGLNLFPNSLSQQIIIEDQTEKYKEEKNKRIIF